MKLKYQLFFCFIIFKSVLGLLKFDTAEYFNANYKYGRFNGEQSFIIRMPNGFFISSCAIDLRTLSKQDEMRLNQSQEVNFQFTVCLEDSSVTGIKIDAAPIFLKSNDSRINLELYVLTFGFNFYKREKDKSGNTLEFDSKATCADYLNDLFGLKSMPSKAELEKLIDSYPGMFTNINTFRCTKTVRYTRQICPLLFHRSKLKEFEILA